MAWKPSALGIPNESTASCKSLFCSICFCRSSLKGARSDVRLEVLGGFFGIWSREAELYCLSNTTMASKNTIGNPSSNNSGRGNVPGYTIQTLKATRKEVTPLSWRYGHVQTWLSTLHQWPVSPATEPCASQGVHGSVQLSGPVAKAKQSGRCFQTIWRLTARNTNGRTACI